MLYIYCVYIYIYIYIYTTTYKFNITYRKHSIILYTLVCEMYVKCFSNKAVKKKKGNANNARTCSPHYPQA